MIEQKEEMDQFYIPYLTDEDRASIKRNYHPRGKING